MMLSVRPSEIHSALASLFWLTNGMTAIDSTAASVVRACGIDQRPRDYKATTASSTTAATKIADLCRLIS
jgi:hypothetical protein